MFYTYVLLCEKDKKLYIGQTGDLKKRIKEHQKGKVKSTAFRRPVKLIYYEACSNNCDSKKREKYFKTGYGRRYLNNRLENFFKQLD